MGIFNEPSSPTERSNGLSKLEFTSIMAMQAILGTIHNELTAKTFNDVADEKGISVTEYISSIAINNAKALLTQLEKEK